MLSNTVKSSAPLRDPHEIDRIAWAVDAVSRHMPVDVTCLTQALATEFLLGRLGQPSNLRIGVAKDEQNELQAHAWIEIEGRVLIGGKVDLSRYVVLPPIEMDTR
jgi:hypothetical protein